ncbi:MAG: cytochrome c [Nitrospirae bacterium]|nr:cytochrome c [Nitrospirota bacterium]
MSKKRVGGTAGLVLLMGMLAMWVAPPVPLAQELSGNVLDGKMIYEWHCVRCHGAGGWGDGPQARELRVPPANFHAPAVQMKSDEQLLTSIEFGLVLSPMHGWRGRLTEQEMQDVVAYVHLLAQRGR